MLAGYDRWETRERVLYRFYRMTERGIRPFPMIYGVRDRTLPLGNAPTSLKCQPTEFQRWAIRGYYTVVDFADYDVSRAVYGAASPLKHCSRSLTDHAHADALFCSRTALA